MKMSDEFGITLPADASNQYLPEVERREALKELDRHIEALKKLEEEEEQLTTQLRDTLDGLQTLEGMRQNETYVVKVVKDATTRLQDQLQQKEIEVAKLAEEAKVSRTALQDATKKHVKATRKLKKEKQLLKDNLDRKKQELEKEKCKSSSKHATIREMKGDLNALRTQANSKAEEVGRLKGRLLAQSKEVKKLRRAFQKSEWMLAPSEKPITAAVLQQQLRHAIENSELKVKLAAAEDAQQEIERQLRLLQREVQILQEEVKQVGQKKGIGVYADRVLTRVYLGEDTEFTVHVVAESGVPEFEDPNPVTGELVSVDPDGTVVKCQVSRNEENRYELKYQPTHTGRFQLHVKVDGSHIGESPFQVQVVKRLQVAEGINVRSIDGLNCAFKLAVSDSGEIVVVERGFNCVSVFDQGGQKLTSFGGQESAEMKFDYPRGVALLSDDTVLVTAKHCVKKFRMDGTFIASVGSVGNKDLQFKEPWALAVDEIKKSIYICDTGNHRIQVLNYDLSYRSCFGSMGSELQQFSTPTCIAVDSHQNVFVADCFNNRVQVFNSEGGFRYQMQQRGLGMEALSQPVGVCIDLDDNLYVLEFDKRRVSIFNNKGQFVKSFGQKDSRPGELSSPYGIAVDSSGRVYVSEDGRDKIHIFE